MKALTLPSLSRRDLELLTIIAAALLLLTGCGASVNNAGSRSSAASNLTPSAPNAPVYIPDPAPSTTTVPSPTVTSNPTLSFEVKGRGNHPVAVCVPALSKLQVRIRPHNNFEPIFPKGDLPKLPDGTPAYDGSPAFYSKLRVKIGIPGVVAWDFVALNESNLNPTTNTQDIGNFSPYLKTTTNSESRPPEAFLGLPEYDVTKSVYGATAYDRLCTYWENKMGRCPQISNYLREAEFSVCSYGETKLMISNIISDYPCNTGDPLGWCKGSPMQWVLDYQQWSLTLEVATESTGNFQ